jgi:sulfur carrier protein
METNISITVNGQVRSMKAEAKLLELLAEMGLNSGRVAIERNLEILPRSTWADTVLHSGDKYEIVHFVGGG